MWSGGRDGEQKPYLRNRRTPKQGEEYLYAAADEQKESNERITGKLIGKRKGRGGIQFDQPFVDYESEPSRA
jgi:hypothetical protein